MLGESDRMARSMHLSRGKTIRRRHFDGPVPSPRSLPVHGTTHSILSRTHNDMRLAPATFSASSGFSKAGFASSWKHTSHPQYTGHQLAGVGSGKVSSGQHGCERAQSGFHEVPPHAVGSPLAGASGGAGAVAPAPSTARSSVSSVGSAASSALAWGHPSQSLSQEQLAQQRFRWQARDQPKSSRRRQQQQHDTGTARRPFTALQSGRSSSALSTGRTATSFSVCGADACARCGVLCNDTCHACGNACPVGVEVMVARDRTHGQTTMLFRPPVAHRPSQGGGGAAAGSWCVETAKCTARGKRGGNRVGRAYTDDSSDRASELHRARAKRREVASFVADNFGETGRDILRQINDTHRLVNTLKEQKLGNSHRLSTLLSDMTFYG